MSGESNQIRETAAPTPEAAAFWHGQKDVDHAVHTLAKRIAMIASVFVLSVAAMAAVFFSSEYSLSNENHQQIQQLNAKVACQDKAFNAVLKDVRLAFQNDKNPADYAKAVTQC